MTIKIKVLFVEEVYRVRHKSYDVIFELKVLFGDKVVYQNTLSLNNSSDNELIETIETE